MDFWQRLCLVTFVFHSSALLCCYSIGYGGQPDMQVWDVQGSSKILVLMDLHRNMLENGTCSDMNPRMVERALAVKWLSSVLKSEGMAYDMTTLGQITRVLVPICYIQTHLKYSALHWGGWVECHRAWAFKVKVLLFLLTSV